MNESTLEHKSCNGSFVARTAVRMEGCMVMVSGDTVGALRRNRQDRTQSPKTQYRCGNLWGSEEGSPNNVRSGGVGNEVAVACC